MSAIEKVRKVDGSGDWSRLGGFAVECQELRDYWAASARASTAAAFDVEPKNRR